METNEPEWPDVHLQNPPFWGRSQRSSIQQDIAPPSKNSMASSRHVWIVLYDDYTPVCRRPDARILDVRQREAPFSSRTETLGVVLDSSDPEFRVIKVVNEGDRAASLADALAKILVARAVRPRDLPSLLGRPQFSESQLLGRTGRVVLADIRSLEHVRKYIVALDESQLAQRFLAGRPERASLTPRSQDFCFHRCRVRARGDSFHDTVGLALDL